MCDRSHHDAIVDVVRTTVTLAPDVAAAVDQLRREKAVGVSEAVNELIRAGLRATPPPATYRKRTFPSRLRMDVSNVAEALETLEGPRSR